LVERLKFISFSYSGPKKTLPIVFLAYSWCIWFKNVDPSGLKAFGFTNIYVVVKEQANQTAISPTVIYSEFRKRQKPLTLLLKLGKEVQC